MDSDNEDARSMEDGLFADEAEESGSETSEKNKSEEERNKNEDDEENDKKKRVVKKKTGPIKRMLLHEDMLCGPNGLLKLEKIFKDFKLRGAGHEIDDVDQILYKLEHWIHNMHPRYPFTQTLERIEFLGMRKKILKVHLKKIRMGMIGVDAPQDMDYDNLPALDSDIEMEETEGHLENHKGSSETHLENGIIRDDDLEIPDDEVDDDDAFMALLEQAEMKAKEVDNSMNGKADADEDMEEPDLSQFVEVGKGGRGEDEEMSEDEELLNLHDKLRDDEDEITFEEFASLQPKSKDLHEQTTLMLTRLESRNSNSDSISNPTADPDPDPDPSQSESQEEAEEVDIDKTVLC